MEINTVNGSAAATTRAKDAKGDAVGPPAQPREKTRRYLLLLLLAMVPLACIYPLMAQLSFNGGANFYTAVKIVGALLALMAGYALTMNFYGPANRCYPLAGPAFLAGGTVEMVNGLAAIPGFALEKYMPGTPAIAGLIVAVLLLAAPFAAITPDNRKQWKNKIPWLSLGTVIASAAAALAAREISFPGMHSPGNFITRPLDLASALVLAAAFAVFLREYRRHRDILTWWLALALGIQGVGHLLVLFSRELSDIYFHAPGIYMVLGGAAALAGASGTRASSYSQRLLLENNNRELQKKIAQLHQVEGKIQLEMHQRKQVEDQLKILLEDVERTNKELEEFAYVVSHDLKAPLRGINSLARWLHEDYGDVLDENGRDILEKLQIRTKRMHNFIEGVLRYSRIGRVKPTLQLLQSDAVAREVIDGISPPDNIPVKIENTLPVIVYDKMLLSQLFQNLIGNAITHLGKPSGEVTISGKDREHVWEFCVKDNGVGIEERHYERIFKIFQCLKARSEKEATGIGLSLVKKITERTGGSVWLESIVGEGSSFYFTIPKESESELSLTGLTVLIIDDNPDFIEVATAMFQREKLKVLSALNGPEAYEIMDVYKNEIQVILMDIHIPGEDAVQRFETMKQVKPEVKIIACTGVNIPEITNQLRKKGLLDGLLAKPFKISDLTRVIGRFR